MRSFTLTHTVERSGRLRSDCDQITLRSMPFRSGLASRGSDASSSYTPCLRAGLQRGFAPEGHQIEELPACGSLAASLPQPMRRLALAIRTCWQMTTESCNGLLLFVCFRPLLTLLYQYTPVYTEIFGLAKKQNYGWEILFPYRF